MIEKVADKSPMIKDLPSDKTIDICYKCLLCARKEAKLQQAALLKFLKFVVEVPDIRTQFRELVSSIVFVMINVKRVPSLKAAKAV